MFCFDLAGASSLEAATNCRSPVLVDGPSEMGEAVMVETRVALAQ